jgi:hypothetical protein
MSTDADKNAEFEKILKEVINVLQDGQKGFADLGEHLKDDTLKRYFLAESLKRANFRAELENELHRKVVTPSDHEILANAEQGEDKAKATYKDALEQELPLPIRQLLTEQQSHIISSHDYVRNHRDALASK